MEIGTIQIFVSVVLILGAAGVALLCDFQKRKNDNLREAMVELELQFRREEQMPVGVSPTRTAAKTLPPPLPAPAPAAMQVLVAEPVQVPIAFEEPVAAANHRLNGRSNGRDRDAGENLVRKSNSAAKTKAPVRSAQDRTNDWTSVSGRRPSPPAPVPEVARRMDEMNSKEALSEWLNHRRTAARIAETAAVQTSKPETHITSTPIPLLTPAPTPVSSIEQKSEPDDLAQIVVFETAVAPEPVILPEPVTELTLPSLGSFHQPEVEIDAFLWESLISGTPAAPTPVAAGIAPTPTVANTQFELIQGTASTWNQLVIPAGMFDQTFLARLLEIKKPFTGLAVSIGINENDGSAPRSEDLIRSTSIFISSLLQDADFGCQSGDDEFVMLCPGPQGAEAQRRLSAIAERLWDFQLRGIGTFSILFSWGGVEVNNELPSDAIACAADRMYQTKRSRKTVSMESANQRRKAV